MIGMILTVGFAMLVLNVVVGVFNFVFEILGTVFGPLFDFLRPVIGVIFGVIFVVSGLCLIISLILPDPIPLADEIIFLVITVASFLLMKNLDD